MIRLVWSAIRSRRAQVASIWALTLLAVAAAAATPWYVEAAREQVAGRLLAAAPADQRLVTAASRQDRAGGALTAPQVLDRMLAATKLRPQAPALAEERTLGRASSPAAPTGQSLAVARRDRVCDMSVVDGSCPDAAGEIMIGRVAAEGLRLRIGDTVAYTGDGGRTSRTLTVVGLYRPKEVGDTYWHGVFGQGLQDLEPAYATAETVAATSAGRATVSVTIRLTAAAYTRDLARRLEIASQGLGADGISLTTYAGDLADRIAADQVDLLNGVAVAAGRLVVLCGVALFVAVRFAAQSHRADLGLVRLRGVRPWRVWAGLLGPTVAPMVAGALIGAPLGVLAARLLAGP
ncbi:MAG: hypothetical protein HOV79_21710, partial [Hamadaea sp.]|nr:hypothetical protein [Hamadaea sp.]